MSGIGVGIFGIISEYFFFKDYWNPPLLFQFGDFGGIEDFIFGFVAGGVGAVIFNVVFRKKLINSNNPHRWMIPVGILIQLLSFIFLPPLTNINSIYASAIGMILNLVLLLTLRRDLVLESLFSATLSGAILIALEGIFLILGNDYLENYFKLHNFVPLVFGIVPVTELVWGMAFGALVAPSYEVISGKKILNEKSTKSRK